MLQDVSSQVCKAVNRIRPLFEKREVKEIVVVIWMVNFLVLSPIIEFGDALEIFCDYIVVYALTRNSQSLKDDNEPLHFSEQDWEQLNNIIGYKEGDDGQSLVTLEKGDVLQTSLDVHMNHNASKLFDGVNDCLAELSCESLDCSIRLYTEAKVFDMKLGSYKLSSPNGLLAKV